MTLGSSSFGSWLFTTILAATCCNVSSGTCSLKFMAAKTRTRSNTSSYSIVCSALSFASMPIGLCMNILNMDSGSMASAVVKMVPLLVTSIRPASSSSTSYKSIRFVSLETSSGISSDVITFATGVPFPRADARRSFKACSSVRSKFFGIDKVIGSSWVVGSKTSRRLDSIPSTSSTICFGLRTDVRHASTSSIASMLSFIDAIGASISSMLSCTDATGASISSTLSFDNAFGASIGAGPSSGSKPPWRATARR
mmetsp:Transcript_36264/g.56362  ORF Transcript_36264/g.56362 Transcript_36264/m.56362 type:complete len:254 (+) Transcript_36264:751-1512(+)